MPIFAIMIGNLAAFVGLMCLTPQDWWVWAVWPIVFICGWGTQIAFNIARNNEERREQRRLEARARRKTIIAEPKYPLPERPISHVPGPAPSPPPEAA